MARDADLFFQNLITALKNNSTLQGIVRTKPNGDAFVSPSRYVPVGNVYPQVTVQLDAKESDSVFPSGMYNLIVILWMSKDDNQNYSKSVAFRNLIDEILNHEGDQFTAIDVPGNTGVRVPRILRRHCEFGYDREHDKNFADYRMDVVISEYEDWRTTEAGNKPWV